MQLGNRRALALIVVVFCALGALHSVIVPLFEAPDEIWHFSFIELMARQRALPVQPTESKDIWLREAGQPPLYHILSALFVAPFDTTDFPDFVRFNLAHPAVNADSESESPNVFIHTPYEAFPYRGSVLAVHVLRLLGVLWGAGTIVGVYSVAREVVARRPDLALAAAGVTALNPHFIFISSVINNDAAAACVCTWALWACIRLARGQANRRVIAGLGVLLGLGLLSKMSALALLPLIALSLVLAWWRDRDWRALLGRGTVILVLTMVVAGWWYVRNWVLYGDPLGWSIWLIDIGVQRITFDELLRQFGHVFTSFWAPADGLYPPPVFWALGALLALAAVGWCALIARLRWSQAGDRAQSAEAGPLDGHLEGLLLAGVWFVMLFIGLIRYMTTTPSAEGRLLFPGIASSSVLLALGWDAVLPRRWVRGAAVAVGVGLLAFSIGSPVFAIMPRYALPLMDARDPVPKMTPLNASWGSVQLLGAQVEPDVAGAGDTVYVSVYWRATGVPPPALRAVVRLWTASGRLIGQRDRVPAGEMYPPDLWRVGDTVRDVYPIRLEGPGPAMCRVMISAYDGDDSLGEITTAPLLKLAGSPLLEGEIPHPTAYTLGDQAALIGYELPDADAFRKGVLPVTLYWRALGEMDEDYTVFVHLVSADEGTVGQGDGPPLGGDYPTSYWSPGEMMADTHLVSPGRPLPADSYLMVGLYRPVDGTRLPVYAATGDRVPGDAIRIELD